MPEDRAPSTLGERVRFAVETNSRRSRPKLRAVAAAAAALAIALIAITVGLPVRTFRIAAAEASPLIRITSLDITREISDTDAAASPPQTMRIIERIRYRAPGFERIERTITVAAGSRKTLEIRRPGIRYVLDGASEILATSVGPEIDPVPEPLSPSIALVGHDVGPGPVVAGRATRMVELDVGAVTRHALVDAMQATVLDASVGVVLSKNGDTFRNHQIAKKTLSIDYNPSLPDSLFAPPAITPVDNGFRFATPRTLVPRIAAEPRGFDLVQSVSDGSEARILYAKGSFTILVRLGFTPASDTEDPVLRLPASAGGRSAELIVGLYDNPTLSFFVQGHAVTIAAPLPQADLERLAAQMFPGSE